MNALRARRHGFAAPTDEGEGVFEGDDVCGDECGELAEGVAEEVVECWGAQTEVGLEDAEDGDGGEEDGGLGVGRVCEV